ncbi:hypothetical protein DPMN_047886 [Dreissena polymorpha]|uniref:Uncharacterized protein n=1 Tax=Dreissena polymorpha TaxID=45954 RepID=A0A9D4D8I9_DREPO|nr:hypothetical protein DPMN_047886 [Dreissena polymorpha]
MNTACKNCPVEGPNYALNHGITISLGKLDSDKAILAPSGSRFSSRKEGITNQGFTISSKPTDCSSSSNSSTINHVASSQSAEKFSHNAQSMNPRIKGERRYIPECFTNQNVRDSLARQDVPVTMALKSPRYPTYTTENSRLQSYFAWSHTTPTAEECTIAGFFYTGS